MASRTASHLRWSITALLAASTALNYLDRQTLSILVGTIQKDIKFTDVQYSYITTTFLIGYTVMTAISGRLLDWMGTRKGLSIAVAIWSFASVLHPLCRTVTQFSLCRLLLGIGESANFPAGVKAVAESFPVRERAFAIGIFNSGSALGAALGAPLIAFSAVAFGWRATFVITGALGFLWVLAFLKIYRPQSKVSFPDEPAEAIPDKAPAISFWRVLRMKAAWGCFAARIFIDPVTYFLIFWVPKYLEQERGFNLIDIGHYLWAPYLALAAGTVFGGYLPRQLVLAGWTVNRARKGTMLISSLLIPICCIVIITTSSTVAVLIALGIFMFSHGAWGNIAIPAEVFPENWIGTVAGLGGLLGGITGIAGQLAIGQVLKRYSFTPVFLGAGLAYPAAFLSVCVLIKHLGSLMYFQRETKLFNSSKS